MRLRTQSPARALLLILGCLCTPWVEAAEGFVELSYPLTVTVDGERVSSEIHLELEIQRYDAPFEAFAAGDLDRRERRFVEWVRAIQSRDYTRAASMLAQRAPSLPAPERSSEKSRVVVSERTPRQIVDLYHGAFGAMRDLTVVAQILAGNQSLFVWQDRQASEPIRRGFAIDENLEVSEITMERPVELLIVNGAMNPPADAPTSSSGIPGHASSFEYALPLAGSWNAGDHPVTLQFDGKAVEIPIPTEERTSAIARLYSQVHADLASRDVESFEALLTPRSRQRWVRWRTSLDDAAFEYQLAAMTRPRVIRFILDAGAFSIVFHGPAGNWRAGALEYDYVVTDPASGELRFANFAYANFLDDVLGSRTLFDQNVLRGSSEVEE